MLFLASSEQEKGEVEASWRDSGEADEDHVRLEVVRVGSPGASAAGMQMSKSGLARACCGPCKMAMQVLIRSSMLCSATLKRTGTAPFLHDRLQGRRRGGKRACGLQTGCWCWRETPLTCSLPH